MARRPCCGVAGCSEGLGEVPVAGGRVAISLPHEEALLLLAAQSDCGWMLGSLARPLHETSSCPERPPEGARRNDGLA
eukprot:14103088-Alexandrium_andersonii.AAC.1